ncbi:MAG: hypothetical protein ABF315_11330, partial [Lentimonas sp.]
MPDNTTHPILIDLDKIVSPPWCALNPFISRAMSIRPLNGIYANVHKQLKDSEYDPEFFMKTLRVMGVQFEVDKESLERLPKEGPLVVIANHPFGGVDGVVLGALLQSVREDTKLMGNYLLG